jgi:hypothetical protein
MASFEQEVNSLNISINNLRSKDINDDRRGGRNIIRNPWLKILRHFNSLRKSAKKSDELSNSFNLIKIKFEESGCDVGKGNDTACYFVSQWIKNLNEEYGEIQNISNLNTKPQKESKEFLNGNCFDSIEITNNKIQAYLAKNPNNFVLHTGPDNYECWSMDYLRNMWELPGEEGNYPPRPAKLPNPYYKMFYKCNHNSQGYIVDKNDVFVKLSNLSTTVEKPPWIFDGTPPEPRVFRLVPTGRQEVLMANNVEDDWIENVDYDGVHPGGLTGQDHCMGDPDPIYRLEPIESSPINYQISNAAEEQPNGNVYQNEYPWQHLLPTNTNGSTSGATRNRSRLSGGRLKKRSRSKNKSAGSKRKSKKSKSKRKKKCHKK